MSNVIPLKKPVSRKVPGLLQLYVELAWIKPKVWRRIVVAESITLAKLHQVLQTAFDWENCHLHEFNIGGERFGIPDPEFGWEPVRSEKRIQLKTALGTLRSFRYIYDFGDHWEHQIKVEKRLPGDPERTHRVTCLAGANAAPPEDVGGAPGYEYFVAAVTDPDHPEYQQMLEWHGSPFDPARFDDKTINRLLSGLGS